MAWDALEVLFAEVLAVASRSGEAGVSASVSGSESRLWKTLSRSEWALSSKTLRWNQRSSLQNIDMITTPNHQVSLYRASLKGVQSSILALRSPALITCCSHN